MSLRSRIAAILSVTAAVAVAAYTAYWFHVAGELRKGVEDWAAARRAAGWTVELGEVATGGFPGRVALTVSAPHLVTPAGLEWRGAALHGRVSPWSLRKVAVSAPGRHELRVAGAGAVVGAGRADLLLRFLPDGRLDDASLTAAAVRIEAEGGAVTLGSLAVLVDPLEVAAPRHDAPTVSLALAAQDVELPPLPGLVLDQHVAMADLKARVLGPIADEPALAALSGWSEAGGTVEIDRLSLDWPPLGIEAEGTLAFDPKLVPLAALTARVRGYGELIDRLARAGTLAPGPATAAKLLMGLMARTDPRGHSAVPVPVSVQDGAVMLGPARVATLPPPPWVGGGK